VYSFNICTSELVHKHHTINYKIIHKWSQGYVVQYHTRSSFSRKDFSISFILLVSSCRLLLLQLPSLSILGTDWLRAIFCGIRNTEGTESSLRRRFWSFTDTVFSRLLFVSVQIVSFVNSLTVVSTSAAVSRTLKHHGEVHSCQQW